MPNLSRLEMTCTLILMRHSHAADGQGCRDFDRQLTVAGVRLAADTGRLLSKLCIVPDLIVTSAAVRTVQTGRYLAEQFDTETRLVPRQDLYQAGPAGYLSAISAEAEPMISAILCIGHNPGIGLMISNLAGQRLAVPPAAVGIFEVDAEDWIQLPPLNSANSQLTHLIIDAQLSSKN